MPWIQKRRGNCDSSWQNFSLSHGKVTSEEWDVRKESQRESGGSQGSPGSFGGFLVGFGVISRFPICSSLDGTSRSCWDQGIPEQFLRNSRLLRMVQVSHFNPGIPGEAVDELSSFLPGIQGEGHSLLPKESIPGKTILNFPSSTPGNWHFSS